MKQYTLFALAFILSLQVSWAQTIDAAFFTDVDNLLKKHVSNGQVDYAALKNNTEFNTLIKTIATADVSNLDDNTLQAFYINAYNLFVVKKATSSYPVTSVQEYDGFFDSSKITVAGNSLTLNTLEKKYLLNEYNDPRYHFVLVCGALGCPPITNFAYTPANLDAQMEKQAKLALNDPNFIRVSGNQIQLSQIFKWYASDFGKSTKDVISYINSYRMSPLPESGKVSYYEYDWTLNDQALSRSTGSTDGVGSGSLGTPQASNAFRYIVSSTIPKGTAEIKIFNNLYSQQTTREGLQDLTDRSSFFSTSLSALYGLTDRVNVGINGRWRRVRNNALPSSAFSVFTGNDDENGSVRTGVTQLGPIVRLAPVKAWSNFSIQSSFLFAIGEDLEGTAELPFIDWNGHTWWTQFFNDFSIGNKFSLFTEIDLLIEDIGDRDEGFINRVSTPATLIFSYVPTTKWTLYTLASYSPFWQENFDYFRQFGVGSKYQFTPNFELEVLYTDFSNQFLANSNGVAETINLGIRVNIN